MSGPKVLTALILTGTILNIMFLALAGHEIKHTMKEIGNDVQRNACRHANPELEDWSESYYCD